MWMVDLRLQRVGIKASERKREASARITAGESESESEGRFLFFM